MFLTVTCRTLKTYCEKLLVKTIRCAKLIFITLILNIFMHHGYLKIIFDLRLILKKIWFHLLSAKFSQIFIHFCLIKPALLPQIIFFHQFSTNN